VVALALPGVALAAVVMTLPIPPGALRAPAAGPPVSLGAALRSFSSDARELLQIRTLRWLIASTTVMAFAAGGLGAWLLEFLIRPIDEGGKGMSKEAASSLMGLALLGGLSGIVVGARVADKLRARMAAGRMWTIVTGMTLTAPCAAAAILLPDGIPLYVIGVATLFFISWYHAPMAATVDDLAPKRLAVSAQGLVIFTMHMFGTAPATWVVGAISKRSALDIALWVPTGALAVAAICMALATTSFARDHARARARVPAASEREAPPG
jgi:sugar phosphate permease